MTVNRGDGSPVGLEILLFSRQEKSPLARLGVLQGGVGIF